MTQYETRLPLLTALLVVISLTLAHAADAQTFPSATVRMVVPYAAGGPTDIVARLLSEKLAERWSQPVVVDNRPGAGGNIGADAVAKAPPDGHTLLLTAAGPIAINESLYAKLPFDPARDLTPITLLVSAPNVLTVSPALGVNSVSELVKLAKEKPGQLNFASGGSGTPPHLAAELFKTMAGIDVLHVPYKGGPQASTAVMTNEVAFYFDSPAALSLARSGKVKAIAVTSAQRAAVAAELPTIAESGVPKFEVTAWFGLLAPAGTPADVVTRVHADVLAVLAVPAVRARLLAIGFEPVGNAPAAFSAFIRDERAKWRKVVKDSGATVE